MGCTSSKLDELPAVALCRERCAFLDDAIHQRYALAEAHFAYMLSLRGVGLSLHRFFDQDLDNSTVAPPSPLLNLPPIRKGDTEHPYGSPPRTAATRHSRSNSGSHLHFHSDSDSPSESPLHHHSGNTSPIHYYDQVNYANYETLSSYSGGGFMNANMNINYMKNQATPSVSYQQRPMSAETVHMGESSSSYSPFPFANQNPNSYPYGNKIPSSGYSDDGGGGINGFFGLPPSYGSSYPRPQEGTASTATSEASTLKPPPPPPSPPRASAWDFLNPFESFEKYFPPYTPSRHSKEELREEGIPDLEDEDSQQEVVKEVHGERKFVDGGGSGGKIYTKGVVAENQDGRANASVENDLGEYEEHMVDKKVVGNEERSGDRGNVAAFKARGDSEVMEEIKVQFERASDSGNELAKMLEVGKYPYKKSAAYYVSSKMVHVVTPSLPVTSQPSTFQHVESFSIDEADLASLEIDEDARMGSGNLSSTLHKLFLWEKKLYEEVKAEEKMRVLHERKSRKLKQLDERGAEAHKVHATRTLVRSLSTKIRIAIQVVDKISVKLNKLREEELWPQLNEFIQGLTRMWKGMLECHRCQCQAIVQAKRLDAVASRKYLSDAHLEAALQLEHELISWTLRFSCWVGAQKGYVRALNNWLLKCLLYTPEETPDGVAPFSPGRIGAPPVFVICNQWSQALDKISEKEVVDSMRDFATSVLHLWERDKLDMRQRMMANKDMERKVKSLDREDQKIQKEIQTLDKMIFLVSGDASGLPISGNVVYQSDTSKTSSLQVGLQHIFETMERFAGNYFKAYEELLQRIELDRQDRLVQESEQF